MRPDVAKYRGLVRLLRSIWRSTQERLVAALNKIVDPAALSLVILQETRRKAKKVG